MANDFSGDSNCVALYRFESAGALNTDSKGSNTLTASGSPSFENAAGNFKEGVGAVYHLSSYQYRNDADLSAGFPLKNGDTTKQYSFTFWYKPYSSVQYAQMCGKWDWTGNKRSFGFQPGNSTYNSVVSCGYTDGVQVETFDTGWKPTNGQWYHYGVVIDGVNKTIRVRVWGATENAIVLNYTATMTNVLWIGDAPWHLNAEAGGYNVATGHKDEVAVFNDLLSVAEIDAIRNQNYTGPFNNDISGSKFVAQWRFEPGALTTDSKGSNTLVPSTSNPTSDAANCKVGSGAVTLTRASSQFYKVADASLDTGFPFKGASPTYRSATFCFWLRPTTVAYNRGTVFAKWGGASPGIALQLKDSMFRIQYSTPGGQQYSDIGPTLVASRWYHVGLIVDGVNGNFTLRLYDDTTGVATSYTWTGQGAYTPPSGPTEWMIGALNPTNTEYCDAKYDDFIVANEILSVAEVDLIRSGNYNSGYYEQRVGSVGVSVLYDESPFLRVGGVGRDVLYNSPPIIKVSQAIEQVEYELAPITKVSQAIEQVEYELAPITKVSQAILQIETERAATGAYVSQALMQVEYFVPTNLEIPMDIISIEITPLSLSLQLIQHMDVVNMLIEALTLMPSSFGVSVATENILITPHNISLGWGVNMSTLAIEIALLTATVELISKRIFPLPPTNRMLQSQLNKRKFPVGH